MNAFQALVSLLLISLAFGGGMEIDDINDDSYTLRQGSTSECPETINFRTENAIVKFTDIEYNSEGTKCEEGGSVNLRLIKKGAAIADADTASVNFFKGSSGNIDDFLIGDVTGKEISCGGTKFQINQQWLFLKPDDDLTVDWKVVFGTAPEFSTEGIDTSDSYKLDDDERYLIIGQRCFYEDTSFSDKVCFPASGSVQLEGGSVKRMDQLATGDRVNVGNGQYSDIFGWTHQDSNVKYSFVKLSTENGHEFTATPGHFIYADGQIITMKNVHKGMKLRMADGQLTTVIGKERVRSRGLYNPQTVHGDIVVDGIVATTYTNAVEPKTAHALLAPLRAGYKAAMSLVQGDHSAEL